MNKEYALFPILLLLILPIFIFRSYPEEELLPENLNVKPNFEMRDITIFLLNDSKYTGSVTYVINGTVTNRGNGTATEIVYSLYQYHIDSHFLISWRSTNVSGCSLDRTPLSLNPNQTRRFRMTISPFRNYGLVITCAENVTAEFTWNWSDYVVMP